MKLRTIMKIDLITPSSLLSHAPQSQSSFCSSHNDLLADFECLRHNPFGLWDFIQVHSFDPFPNVSVLATLPVKFPAVLDIQIS